MMDRGSEIEEAVDFNIWAERASGPEEVSVEIPETSLKTSSPSQRRSEGQTIGGRGGLSESGGRKAIVSENRYTCRSFPESFERTPEGPRGGR